MIKNRTMIKDKVIKDETNGWIDPQLMDNHQQRKHKRIMAISGVIKRRGKVNYKRFLAEMQFHGLRKSVAEEYLEVLKDLGIVKFDSNEIVWNGRDESPKPDFDNQSIGTRQGDVKNDARC